MRGPSFVFGSAVILLVVAGAIAAPWLAPYDPNVQMFDRLTLDGAPLPPGGAFLLGTDLLGRTMFSRLLCGARTW
jgi:peptide/nickel transport system permease protein